MAKVGRQKLLATLGQRIRAARKEKGWTQEELALKANTATNYIGGIERGEKNFSVKKIFILCEVLGIDVSDITRGLKLE